MSAAEEVLHVALTARYYGRTARRYLRSERGEGLVPVLTRLDRHYVPKGVVGVIGPWNYPLTMAISDGLAALVAGNAIMLKPDHQTPFVALAAVELLRSTGLPTDLWQARMPQKLKERAPQVIEQDGHQWWSCDGAIWVDSL